MTPQAIGVCENRGWHCFPLNVSPASNAIDNGETDISVHLSGVILSRSVFTSCISSVSLLTYGRSCDMTVHNIVERFAGSGASVRQLCSTCYVGFGSPLFRQKQNKTKLVHQ